VLTGVAGSVDDHFAKSLGSSTWTRIKSALSSSRHCDDESAAAGSVVDTRTSSVNTDSVVDTRTSSVNTDSVVDTRTSSVNTDQRHASDNCCMSLSVDDHFAKALGDTWLRIKAEQEAHVADAATALDQSS